MNRTAVFSKTGKGLLEIKNKGNKLSKDQYRVLNLVDGKANLLDLADKAKVSELEVRKILNALSEGGFIKEFSNPAGGDLGSSSVPPSASYADDLDFTTILGPAQPVKPGFYQSALTEQRQREEAERKASEAAATRAREEAERRAKEEAARRAAAEEAARKVREEAERRAREEHARQEKLAEELRAKADAEKKAREDAARKTAAEKAEAERRAKEDVERRAKIQAEARARVEAERKAREEAERKAREEEERKRREEEERKRKEEEERKRREEEERKRKEEEERKRREEEERKRREEEERKRREEEERTRKEEEERKRREEEERKRKEEEERKRREEEERKRKEEEERKRREEEERKRKEEEERKRREEEERKRKEEEERKRREEEERRRKEEEERKRREEEERKRKEEEERMRREEEERRRREEEERKRKEEEEERMRRELEEKHRREQEEIARKLEQERRRLEEEPLRQEEEARKRKEEEERRRREDDVRRQREDEERRLREGEERKRKEEEERKRREEEERKRKEDEERRRKEQDERKRKEEEERKRRAAPRQDDLSLDMTSLPVPEVSANLDTDLEALKRAEEQVEKEFTAKEEAIRKALEEQERRFRMEEEARAAMDKAEREARERADREARELALAAEKARKDAEQKAREEAGRRAQEEKERRAREQEERKKQAEDERKKRERERREAEQRAREEELARRRKEQEEADRRKGELERMHRETRRRAFGPGKIAAVAGVALIGLGVAAVELAPLSAYAPAMEKVATQVVGEPVRIGTVKASLFPGFHLTMNNVTVGNAQDVKATKVVVFMGLGGLFGDAKSISKVVVDGPEATQDALGRMSRWLAPEGKPTNVVVDRIEFKSARLETKGMKLPAFNADVVLGPERAVRGATLETSDGHVTVEITPREQATEVVARGRNLVLPIGPQWEFADFTGRGTVSGSELRFSELEFSLYNGQGRGTAVLSWGAVWNLEGEFELQRVELEPAMKALQVDIASDGALEAKGKYALQATALENLFSTPRIDAQFLVRKGNLSGLDLVRALQSPSRDGVAGGKTKFEELSGSFAANAGRIQYNGVKMSAGALVANGQAEVSPAGEVTGRTYVELRSSANAVRGNFRITGGTTGMVLKP
jgi:hypothetical protein